MQLVTMTQTQNNGTKITKYRAMEAFFRTEDEGNDVMATQLNELIGIFYEQEQIHKRNITELTFDLDRYKSAIEYINKVAIM